MSSVKQGGSFVWGFETVVNQHVQLVHRFEVSIESVGCALLNISADSQYAAWINGKLAGFGQYADYPEYKVYDSIPVTHLLQAGTNTLCILGYCQNEDSSVYRQGIPGVWFEIVSQTAVNPANGDLLANSGEDTICRAAPDYISGEMERVSPQLSFSFRYDARKYDGWNTAAYLPDCTWSKACVRENVSPLHLRPVRKLELYERRNAALCAQGVFQLRQPVSNHMGERMQQAFLSHRELPFLTGLAAAPAHLPNEQGISFHADGQGDGVYVVLDLGAEEAGLIDLEIEVASEARIDIGYGEHLDDLRVRTYVGRRTFAAHYICRKGRQTFTHYLKRAGCRYIQLHVHADRFTLFYAGLRPTPYPLEHRGAFKCSDSLHNKIYDVSVRTLMLCMHEHYEDCPWREQALYSMDSRNQMLFGYYCFGEYEFAKASIRLMGLSIRRDRLLELCSPARIGITIPAFSLTWILQLYEYVLFSGDTGFGYEMYEVAKSIIHAFTDRVDGTGLLPCFQEQPYWNFYEWAGGLDGGVIVRKDVLPKTYDAPLNALYSSALSAMAKLAAALGRASDSSAYESLRSDINRKIAESFWDREKRLFCSFIENGIKRHYAELTQSLVVYCGACPEPARETVLDALCAKTGELVPATLSSTVFKYDALLTMPEKYGHAVIEEIATIWGNMLFKGATAFWETEEGPWDFSNAGSLCHGWSAVPAYIYQAYVLGIKPTAPGFTDFVCRPVPSRILAADGIAPAPGREYHIQVSKENGSMNYVISP